jgi:hypothetical protein
MNKYQQAVNKAIKALPNENTSEISAIINPDGTVDTYTSLSAPEWLSYSSRILRDKINRVLTQ